MFWFCLHFSWLTNSCLKVSRNSSIGFSLFSSVIRSEADRLREEDTGKRDREAWSHRITEGERGSLSSVFAVVWFWLWSSRASGSNVPAVMKRALQPHSSLSSSSNTSLLQPFLQFPQFLPGSHLLPLYLLFIPAFSTSLTPSLPVPCQCDPCVAETCWGSRKTEYLQISQMCWALLQLHTHGSSSITTTAGTLLHTQGYFIHCVSTPTHTYSYFHIVLNMQTHILTNAELHTGVRKVLQPRV